MTAYVWAISGYGCINLTTLHQEMRHLIQMTVLASDREVVDSDEFQEENFTDSDEVDAD